MYRTIPTVQSSSNALQPTMARTTKKRLMPWDGKVPPLPLEDEDPEWEPQPCMLVRGMVHVVLEITTDESDRRATTMKPTVGDTHHADTADDDEEEEEEDPCKAAIMTSI